jgi:outer membrane protein, heavy metal efflux system
MKYSVRITILALLWLGIVRAVSAQHAHEHAQDSSLVGLYQMLGRIGVHPMVQMQEAGKQAARDRIAMKSSLMNPTLMLGVQNLPTNSFSFSDDPMTAKMIGVSQDIPFPGKLSAEANIAAQDTVTAETKITEAQNELARDIKQAYFEIYHLQRSVSTNEHHTSALDELLDAARQKLATGKTTQSEILGLELERSDIETQIADEQAMLAMRRAELERAVGGDIGSLSMPAALTLPPLKQSLAELDTLAAHKRATLIGLRSEADQQSLAQRRAELDKYPDFNVSLQYMQRSAIMDGAPAPDMVSATLGIQLPVNYGNQRASQSAEADAMRTMKRAEERSTMLMIHSELASSLAKLEGLRKQYDILRHDVYPIVEASLETSKANYSYGKAGIEQVLRDELALLHREHDRYRLEAEYNKTLAEIEYLTGATLVHYSAETK